MLPLKIGQEGQPGIQMHQIRPEEADELCEFAAFTFRKTWADQNDPEAFEDYCKAHFHPDAVRRELQQQGSVFWFAKQEDQVLAYLKINFNRPVHDLIAGFPVQLERLYVRPEWQGHGLGARLIAFTEQQAADAGGDWLWLSVWTRAPRGILFYEKLGFDIFSEEIFWLGEDPQPDWLMKKRLIP